MKILINATANDTRGPLSLTKDFLEALQKSVKHLASEEIEIKFLVSVKELTKYTNNRVKVEYYYTPKKSFLHKLYFEYLYLPSMLKKEKIDAYISLQNTGIKRGDYKQIVLVHTPLPFESLSLDDLEFKNYLKYKILLKNILKKQLSYIDFIIVQTKWMQDELVNLGFDKQIDVIRPESLNLVINNYHEEDENLKFENKNIKLLYPTNYDKYKNNKRAIQAIEKYNLTSENKVTLYLTIEGEDSEHIKFLGKISYESMYKLYCSMDALFFPSLTETLGLPLLEARQCNLFRIVSDRKYAKEVCGDNAIYFDPTSVSSMVESISKFVGTLKLEITSIYKENNKLSEDSYLDYIRVAVNEVVKK